MEKFFEYVDQLEKYDSVYFNIENFMAEANKERFQEYLNKVLLKYVRNKNELLDLVYQKEMNDPKNESSIIKITESKYSTIVPVRKTLYDELICIHNISLLIDLLKRNKLGIESEIIPCFNEYEYISNYNEKLQSLYLKYIMSNAVNASKYIYDDKEQNIKQLAIIYSDYILKERKDNYNIKELNKINAKSLDLKKALEKKGYTI